MEHVGRPESFNLFPETVYYQDLLESSLESAKRTLYLHRGTEIPLPAFSFCHLPEKNQLVIAHKLSSNFKNKGLKLIYEIGFGTSLSPLDTALAERNSAIMGFDPNGKFPEKIRAGTEYFIIPKDKTKSLTVLFSLNALDLIKSDFPKASRLQCISPYPTMVQDMIFIGSQLSNKVDILPNPNMVEPREFKNIVNNLPPPAIGKVMYLTKAEITKKIGTSRSSYVFPSNQERFPLIEISY